MRDKYKDAEIRKIIAVRVEEERKRRTKKMKSGKEKKISKQEFADELGITETTYIEITNKYTKRGVKVDFLYKVAEVCGCDIGYLLGEYDERTRVASDICKETGLSVKAIECLRESKGKIDIDFISFYIEKYLSRKVGERLNKIIDLEAEKRMFEWLASRDLKLKEEIKQVTEENIFKEFYNTHTTNWDKLLVYSFNLHEGIKKITNDFIEEEVKRKRG